MALTVFSNLPSLNAQRNLGKTQASLTANLARLSSGMRINSSADDAAGLAISEKLRSQIRSLSQAERNANDGFSLLQTAEGGMNEISGVLVRMRELAIQASNGTLGTTERTFLNDEFTSIRNEIDRLASATEFNGVTLLAGTLTNLRLQVGIGTSTNDRILVSIGDLRSTALGSTAMLSAQSITTITNSQTAIGVIDAAITDVSTQRGQVGSYQNRLNITTANLASARENLSAANSRIRDVDVAEESAALTRHNILMQAGVSVLAQANQIPSLVLSLLR